MAILNNGKLVDRKYRSNTAPRKEETGLLKTGGGLIVAMVAVMGILALAVLMGDQDW